MLFNTLQMSVRCIRSNALRTQNVKTLIKTQSYSNWVHRQPSAIINEEIASDDVEETPKPRKYVVGDEEHKRMRQRPKRSQKPFKKPEEVRSDATYKEDGTPNFIKLADSDRELMSLMLTLKSRKLRQKKGQILLEGQRLISDAMKAGLTPEIIICSSSPQLEKLSLPERGLKLYKVPYKMIQLWSSLTTTPGIVAIFKAPESFEKPLGQDVIPLKIICDNVREPGNMGSILRAAAGVGCERVILTKGCVDVWEPKVLRSAAGAHFRISISKSLNWEKVKSMINPGSRIFAADNNVEIHDEEFTGNDNSVSSSETAAENSDDEFADEAANETSDSSEKSSDEEDKKSQDTISSEEKVVEEPEIGGEMRKVSLKELASQLPVIPYYSVDYTNSEIVLIVGGETEGLSYESIELLRESQGVRVNVPLLNEVESLNTSMALGIVAFEVRRQFAIKRNASK